MLKKILTISLASVSVAFGALQGPSHQSAPLNCDCQLGPYNEFEDDQLIIFSFNTTTTLYDIKEKIVISDLKTKEVYQSKIFSSHTESTFRNYELSMTFKLSEYFSNNGINVTLSYTSKNYNEEIFSVGFYPRKQESLEIYDGNVKSYESKVVGFRCYRNNVILWYDSINFSDFNDYIDTDRHYKLDISKNHFQCLNSYLFYDDASIFIADRNNVFKNFIHDDNDLVEMKLELSLMNKEISFQIDPTNLFVNTRTLDPAPYMLPGYSKTQYLFFPINSLEEINGADVLIKIYGFGYNKLNLVLYLKYDVSRGLIGNCNNNDYCVTGEAM